MCEMNYNFTIILEVLKVYMRKFYSFRCFEFKCYHFSMPIPFNSFVFLEMGGRVMQCVCPNFSIIYAHARFYVTYPAFCHFLAVQGNVRIRKFTHFLPL